MLILGFGFDQIVRFGANTTLARLLNPESFGLLALCMAFMGGLALFSDLGLRTAIIQSKRGEDPAFLNTGLWRKLTNRNVFQFHIRRKDRKYFPCPCVISEDEVFTRLSEVSEVIGGHAENYKQGFFVFQKCFVEVNICSDDVEVTAARNISLDNIAKFVEIVSAEIEKAIGFPCESLHLAGGA